MATGASDMIPSPVRQLTKVTKSRTTALVVLVLAILCGFTSLRAQCSGERWNVKVGVDADVSKLNLNLTTPTTLAALTAIAKPNKLPDNTRVKPTETTVWVISANLVRYARSWDADYHIVFRDSAGRKMIAEIPDPNC